MLLLSVGTSPARTLIGAAWAGFIFAFFFPSLVAVSRRIPERYRRIAGELAGPLTIAVVLAVTHPFLVRLDPPAAHDNPIHLAKSVWTLNDLWPHWSGWSDSAEFGWPLNVLYPPGSSLLPVFVRAFSFWQLDWPQAYAFAMLIGVALTPAGVYALARRPMGRAAATVGAVACLMARGGWFQGGFEFDVVWGVWGTAASVGLSSLGIALFPAVVRGSRKAIVLSAFCVAAAMVCHPFAIIVLGIFGIPRALQLLITLDEGERMGAARGLFLLALAAVGALLLSAWFTFPLSAYAKGYTLGNGESWKDFRTIYVELVSGTLFVGVPPALVLGGVLGLILGVARRRPLSIVSLGCFIVALLLSSSDSSTELGLPRFLPGTAELQFERFTYVMKLMVWIGWAELASAVVPRFDSALPLPTLRTRALTSAAVGFVVAAVVAANTSWSRPARSPAPIPNSPPFGRVETLSNSKELPNWTAAAAFLSERSKEGPFFRTALIGVASSDHELLWTVVLANGLPVVRTTFHAAELFRYDGNGLDPAYLRAQDVRYLLGPTPYPERSDFTLVRRFGRYYLYEWKDFRPNERAHLVSADGTALDAHVEVVAGADHELRAKVVGAPENATLVFHRAPWPRWETVKDGAVLPWQPTRIFPTSRASVVGVKVAGDGEYVLRDRGSSAERLGNIATLLGVLFLAAVLFAPDRYAKKFIIPDRVRPWLPIAISATLTLALLLFGLGAHGLRPGRFNLVMDLDDAEVKLGDVECPHLAGAGNFQCGEQPWHRPGRTLMNVEGTARNCVWAPVSGGRKLEFRWPKVKLGKRFIFGHGLRSGVGAKDPAKASTLTVELGEGVTHTFTQPDQDFWSEEWIDTSSLAGGSKPLRITVSSPLPDRGDFCVDGWVER